jgi:hypothetical protein
LDARRKFAKREVEKAGGDRQKNPIEAPSRRHDQQHGHAGEREGAATLKGHHSPHPFAATHLKPVVCTHNREWFGNSRQDIDAARESQMIALAKINP